MSKLLYLVYGNGNRLHILNEKRGIVACNMFHDLSLFHEASAEEREKLELCGACKRSVPYRLAVKHAAL